MVKSERVYTAPSYLKEITGKWIQTKGMSEVELIEETVGNELWNYPLTEIDHIVENNINVVLVACIKWNCEDDYNIVYRWCEVPEDFEG